MKKGLCFLLFIIMCLSLCSCSSKEFQNGLALYESGEYAKAADIFLQLGDYKDSQSYWCKANYQIGKQYLEQEDYENAEKVLQESQNNDAEAKKLLNWSRFEQAKAQLRHGNHLNAIDILIQIGDYGNYPAYLSEVRYNYGVVCYNAGEYETAAEYFGKSQKSEAQALKYKAQYYSAVKQTNAGKYVAAYETFSSLGNANFDDRVKAANHAVDLYKKLMRYTWKMQYNSEKQICFAFREDVGTMYIFTMNNGKVVSSTSPVVFQMIYAYDGILLVESSGTSHSLKTSFMSTDSVKLSFKTEGLQQANGIYQKESLSADHALSHTINEAATPITVPSYSFSLEKATLTSLNENSSTTNPKEDTSVAVDSSSQAEPEVSSINTTSTTSQTNNSNNKSLSNLKSGKSNNSSNTTQKSKPDNASSTLSQSTIPNSTSSTVSQGKKPNTPSTEQHVHDFSINATCEEPAKCQCGQTSGIANGHLWVAATCTTPKKCKVCNKTEGQALGHSFNNNAPFYCSTCEEENPNALSILNKINVETVDSKVSINNFSFSEFRLMGISTPFGKQGYSFTMDYEIECLSDFGTYQMNIVAYNADNSILSESYVMYNHYGGTLTAGEKEKSSKTFIIYSDSPVTKIEIG